MKRGYLGLLLFLSLYAQEHNERIVGTELNKIDHETMQFFSNPEDIQRQEIVAAYSLQQKKWLYAQVIVPPVNNFSGLACFVKDGPYYNYCALDFKVNARRLLEKEEFEKYRAQKDSKKCSLQ